MGRWLNNAIVYRTEFRPVPLTINLCFKAKLFQFIEGKQKMVRAVENHSVMQNLQFMDPDTRSITALLIETLSQERGVFCRLPNNSEIFIYRTLKLEKERERISYRLEVAFVRPRGAFARNAPRVEVRPKRTVRKI